MSFRKERAVGGMGTLWEGWGRMGHLRSKECRAPVLRRFQVRMRREDGRSLEPTTVSPGRPLGGMGTLGETGLGHLAFS